MYSALSRPKAALSPWMKTSATGRVKPRSTLTMNSPPSLQLLGEGGHGFGLGGEDDQRVDALHLHRMNVGLLLFGSGCGFVSPGDVGVLLHRLVGPVAHARGPAVVGGGDADADAGVSALGWRAAGGRDGGLRVALAAGGEEQCEREDKGDAGEVKHCERIAEPKCNRLTG